MCKKRTAGDSHCGCAGHDPWDWVAAAPPGMQLSLLERLRMRGCELPAPEELSEVAISSKVWELIEQLAQLRVYLAHTDHLSDRALYTWLWEEELPEPLWLEGFLYGGRMFVDVLGSWGDEDSELYLRYYADDEDRALWTSMFADTLPPREQPPFDRDRWLPE